MKKEDKNQLSHSISSNSIRLNSKVERSGITTYFKSLWSWKSEPPQQNTSTTHDTITERDFSGYISDVAEGIDKLKKTVNRSQK
jgi:peptide subunit release factor RF-3